MGSASKWQAAGRSRAGRFRRNLTGDKSIPNEQVIGDRNIGLVLITANGWKLVREHVPAIAEALPKVKAGQVLRVDCGKFVPSKRRKLSL